MWKERWRPYTAGDRWVSFMTQSQAPETEVAGDAAPPAPQGRAREAGEGGDRTPAQRSHQILARCKTWPSTAEANPLTLLLGLQTSGTCKGDFRTLGRDEDFIADT